VKLVGAAFGVVELELIVERGNSGLDSVYGIDVLMNLSKMGPERIVNYKRQILL
jgi:hypothetical protein